MTETATPGKVREAAQAFRLANIVVGLSALCWIVTAVAAQQRKESALAAAVGSVAVGGVIVAPLLLAFAAYRLSRGIDGGSPVLWAVGSALGCIGVLVILHLASTASKWFKARGVKVGLLGPTEASLVAFEQKQADGPPSGIEP